MTGYAGSETCLARRQRAGDGGRLGTNAVMRRTGKSKTAVRRWQERFASDGVDGRFRSEKNVRNEMQSPVAFATQQKI